MSHSSHRRDDAGGRIDNRGGLVRPRTEAVILVPAALLVLVALSFFVLFAYRESVISLLAVRGQSAEEIARSIANRIDRSWPQPDVLRGWAPEAWAVALLDVNRVPTVTVGDLSPRPVRRDDEWSIPRGTVDDVVSAEVAFERGGRRGFVRVDIAASDAVRRARSVRLLVPTVLVANLALVGLLLLYFRSLVGRFDGLVALARRANRQGAGSEGADPIDTDTAPEDDLAILVRAIDQALDRTRSRDDAGALAVFGRTVSRGLEGGVLLLDDGGHVIAASVAAAELLGIDQPERRVPLGEVLGAHPDLVALLEDAVAGRRTVRREACDIHTPSGRRTLGLTANPLREDDGGRAGLMVLFADLTAERRRADRARLADRLAHVGALAAGVAHEMRNSIATLRGYIDLTARSPDPSGAGLVAELSDEASHLERVVEDFLRFARPGSVRPESIDLPALVRRAAADPSLAPTDIEVRTRPADATPEQKAFFADPNLLLHAIRNLLRNACQAQARGAHPELPVVVGLSLDEHEVAIEIDDHGAGLGDQDPDSLFDPFVSGHSEGIGLGLAITRRVVVLHGGEITLVPRPAGGVRARVVLPRVAPNDGER